MLWDTHCHLDQYERVIEVLETAGASTIGVVAVTNSPGAYRLLRTRLGSRPSVVVALGFHPLNVSSDWQSELARFFRLLPSATFIGEIGLDFSKTGAGSAREQRRVFEALLSEDQVRQRACSIHSRGAAEAVIETLADAKAERAILHWYTGSVQLAARAVEHGLWFSVNAAMLTSPRAQSLLKDVVPPDRWLLETDGPFVKVAGGASQPAMLAQIVTQLAPLWGISTSEVHEQLLHNQRTVLHDVMPPGSPDSGSAVGT
jgi:TatD DNase family protein